MKATLIVILLFIATTFSEEYTTEKDVLVLTARTFPQAVAQYENLLVEFYAPWDGHCKIFEVEYAKTAQRLAETDLNVKLAKIDFTIEEELARKYEIRSYPTLILFSKSFDSNPISYKGPRTSSDIINWLKKKTSPSSVEVKTIEDVQILVESNELLVLFLGSSETEAYNNFLKVSIASDVTFAHSHDRTVADKIDVPYNSIVLFRKFDQAKSFLTTAISAEAIKAFINENKNPTFFPSTEEAFHKISREGLDTLLLIRDNNEYSLKAEEAFKAISEEVKGLLILSIVNINDDFGNRFAEQIGIHTEQVPTVMLIRPSKNNLKYLLEDEINIDNIRSFVHDFNNNKIKGILKSAAIPNTSCEDGVLVVVGKNFDRVVLDDNTDVLIAFYASWDGHYKKFAPIYSALATKFKDVQSLTIAKMDIAANEIEGLHVDRFPSIRFYPKGKKHQFLTYDGGLTLEGLSNYLKERSISVEQSNDFILNEL